MSPPGAPKNTESGVENTDELEGELNPFDITKVESIQGEFEGKSIPWDITDAILSRLPVKSLIRFQTLSKLNKAAISDPWFSKLNFTHLSKSDDLFLHISDKRLFSLVRSEGGNFETEAELGAPFGHAVPLCSCNGMVLLLSVENYEELVLWNPSIRRFAIIRIPVRLVDFWLNFGLYHDSRTDDYKVHLVFSCKTRAWVEGELIPCIESEAYHGVIADGCFYWRRDGEIWWFDLRERKTERLRAPDDLGGEFSLTALSGIPCLHHRRVDGNVRIWVRENWGWREVRKMGKTEVRLCHTGHHVFLNSGCFRSCSSLVLCNDSGKGLEERMEISDVGSSDLVPCSESLFFPTRDHLFHSLFHLLFPFNHHPPRVFNDIIK